MKKITLIKLGGSVITNKEVPMMIRPEVLKRLVAEIVQVQKEIDDLFIIGHGQGSFAHAPALRYKTKEGFILSESVIGMAITQDSASQLNRIVVKEFLSQQLPAVSFLFSNSLVTKNNNADIWCDAVLDEYLEKGLLPITAGDVIVDKTKGCTIWSTEKILSYIAQNLDNNKYQVSKVIHVTEVAGVLDRDKKVVKEVNLNNKDEIKKLMTSTKGFDVTGGMWHKIEESLELAKTGVNSFVISGTIKNNLYNCLLNKKFIGTIIKQ